MMGNKDNVLPLCNETIDDNHSNKDVEAFLDVRKVFYKIFSDTCHNTCGYVARHVIEQYDA